MSVLIKSKERGDVWNGLRVVNLTNSSFRGEGFFLRLNVVQVVTSSSREIRAKGHKIDDY